MQKTGQLELPLHSGKAPRWLFQRMVRLARCITEVILIESGTSWFLKLLADPFWFQSFGCVLGFDWHSSGLTTTVCGALKEALKDLPDAGIYFCGGKGAASRKTPFEIQNNANRIKCDPKQLIYASKITAKVDNSALQDGFNLYHHSFVFTSTGSWVVIQQGMGGEGNRWARRYHWHSKELSSYVRSPHKGITSDGHFLTLNLVDEHIDDTRRMIADLSQRAQGKNIADIRMLQAKAPCLPARHQILLNDINPKYLEKILLKTYECKPQTFQALLSLEGVGAKTLRALALVSELVYGANLSFRDPARFSFAHGGKDGHPYTITLPHYETTINLLEKMVNKAKMEHTDKVKALRRLHRYYQLKHTAKNKA